MHVWHVGEACTGEGGEGQRAVQVSEAVGGGSLVWGL